MFYRFRRGFKVRAFNRTIQPILETSPIHVEAAPWTVVSMVSKGDVLMYLLAIKSLYRALGRGNVVAIIDRDTPEALRDTLRRHVEGIEFVILEDIPVGECQRGGTWERILHIMDRTETEYTIQIDSDVLTVADELDEVMHCCTNNIAFTMTDGFQLQPMLEAARIAKATPSEYIGIVTERAFDKYPGAEHLRYIRGSSGFAGFAKGAVTRADLTNFHKHLEPIVGHQRFREWGTEQNASNFAVANAPNAVGLPYPDYASFGRPIPVEQTKVFHFIGHWRFRDGYYAKRATEVIEKLKSSKPTKLARSAVPATAAPPAESRGGLLLALAPSSIGPYLAWRAVGRATDLRIALRSGVKLELRNRKAGHEDDVVAGNIFGAGALLSPVWIPAERVDRIVDIRAGTGLSCAFWSNTYREARIIAFEADAALGARFRNMTAVNSIAARVRLVENKLPPALGAPGFDALDEFRGHQIDIVKIDVAKDEYNFLDDARFRALNVAAVVLVWWSGASQDVLRHAHDTLTLGGFRPQPIRNIGDARILWAFRSISCSYGS
jgi:hypothetical protein